MLSSDGWFFYIFAGLGGVVFGYLRCTANLHCFVFFFRETMPLIKTLTRDHLIVSKTPSLATLESIRAKYVRTEGSKLEQLSEAKRIYEHIMSLSQSKNISDQFRHFHDKQG